MAHEIRIPMPCGGTIRGWSTGEDEIELERVEHEGPGGSKFVEARWRRVEPALEAPEPPPTEPETPADG